MKKCHSIYPSLCYYYSLDSCQIHFEVRWYEFSNFTLSQSFGYSSLLHFHVSLLVNLKRKSYWDIN